MDNEGIQRALVAAANGLAWLVIAAPSLLLFKIGLAAGQFVAGKMTGASKDSDESDRPEPESGD